MSPASTGAPLEGPGNAAFCRCSLRRAFSTALIEGRWLVSRQGCRRSQQSTESNQPPQPRARLHFGPKHRSARQKHEADQPLAPWCGSLAPWGGGFAPWGGGFAPRSGSLAPWSGGLAPWCGRLAPRGGGLAPWCGRLAPRGGGLAPWGGGLVPWCGGLALRCGGLAPWGGGLAPRSRRLAPRGRTPEKRLQGLGG